MMLRESIPEYMEYEKIEKIADTIEDTAEKAKILCNALPLFKKMIVALKQEAADFYNKSVSDLNCLGDNKKYITLCRRQLYYENKILDEWEVTHMRAVEELTNFSKKSI